MHHDDYDASYIYSRIWEAKIFRFYSVRHFYEVGSWEQRKTNFRLIAISLYELLNLSYERHGLGIGCMRLRIFLRQLFIANTKLRMSETREMDEIKNKMSKCISTCCNFKENKFQANSFR